MTRENHHNTNNKMDINILIGEKLELAGLLAYCIIIILVAAPLQNCSKFW